MNFTSPWASWRHCFFSRRHTPRGTSTEPSWPPGALGFENETLIGTLTSRTEAVERLNRDITQEIQERRGIEEELRRAHDDLERRIAERTGRPSTRE